MVLGFPHQPWRNQKGDLYKAACRREIALERNLCKSEQDCYLQRQANSRLLVSQRNLSGFGESDRLIRALKFDAEQRDSKLRPPDRSYMLRAGADIAELDEIRAWYDQ